MNIRQKKGVSVNRNEKGLERFTLLHKKKRFTCFPLQYQSLEPEQKYMFYSEVAD